jgi:autotransporter-associated beta strand protein
MNTKVKRISATRCNRTAKRLHDPTLSNRAFAIFFIVTILIAIGLLLAPKAHAANDLYWDTNGTAAGSGLTTGTWGTSNFWNSDSNGVTNTFTTTTNNTNDVHFSAGTNGGNGTVTINLAQSANSIIFEEASVTLSGGTSITLGGGGGVNSGLLFVSGTNANTISTALILGSAAAFTNNDNTNQTISGGVTGGFDLTINGSGAGGFTFSTGSVNNGGSITNSGTGGTTTISSVIGSNVTTVTENSATSNLILSGANQYTGGTTVTAGTLQLSGSGTLGSTTGTLTVNGGTLDLNSTSQTVGALNGSGGTITTTGSAAASLTVGNGGASGSYSGTITDPNAGSKHLSLTKTGAGTQTLSGNNTYTGGTTVSDGTLFANNATSSTGTGTVTVNGTGTLGGSGKITGAVSVTASGAAINAGATSGAVGTLNINNGSLTALTMTSTSKFIVDMTGNPTPTADQLNITGLVNLGTTSLLQLDIPGGSTFTAGQQFTLINNDLADAISGTFSNAPTGTDIINGYAWMVSYAGGTGNDFVLTAVPEPSTWAAGGLALIGLICSQRRRLARILKRAA